MSSIKDKKILFFFSKQVKKNFFCYVLSPLRKRNIYTIVNNKLKFYTSKLLYTCQ